MQKIKKTNDPDVVFIYVWYATFKVFFFFLLKPLEGDVRMQCNNALSENYFQIEMKRNKIKIFLTSYYI